MSAGNPLAPWLRGLAAASAVLLCFSGTCFVSNHFVTGVVFACLSGSVFAQFWILVDPGGGR